MDYMKYMMVINTLLALVFVGFVGKDMYYHLISGSHFVDIQYIEVTDVQQGVGTQTLTMCREVDKERTGNWTWELSSLDSGRVFSNTQGAVIEEIPDCLMTWTLSESPILKDLPVGDYQWATVVEFILETGDVKTAGSTSNIFQVYE